MVTIHSGSNFNKYDFEGNSTDPKPTEGVKTNQKFLELDTLDIYYFDDFVHNFGNISQMLEFSTSGKFKEAVLRILKYKKCNVMIMSSDKCFFSVFW